MIKANLILILPWKSEAGNKECRIYHCKIWY